MSEFLAAFKYTYPHERGYVNHPNDPGGETIDGIARRSHPNSKIWMYVDKAKSEIPGASAYDLKRHIELSIWMNKEAMAIIESEYAKYWKYDAIADQDVANRIFAAHINMGIKWAHVCLQRALRAHGTPTKEDGVLGAETIGLVNDVGSYIIPAYRSELAGYYRSLDKPDFINGWLNRAYA